MEKKMERWKRRWKRRWTNRWKKGWKTQFSGEIKEDGSFMLIQSDAVLNLSNILGERNRNLIIKKKFA